MSLLTELDSFFDFILQICQPYGPAKIAQRFSAGFRCPHISKSRQGRKNRSAVPAGLLFRANGQPSHEWLGYFQRG